MTVENLTVRFEGTERTVAPHNELTFGREGGLRLPDNPYLHAHCGRFVFVPGDGWVVENLGKLPLTYTEDSGPAHSVISGGQRVRIQATNWTISVSTGDSHYRIEGELPSIPDVTSKIERSYESRIATKVYLDDVRLSPKQGQFVTALALRYLRGEPRPRPTSSGFVVEAVQRTFGWKPDIQRYLELVQAKLIDGGAVELYPDPDRPIDRRDLIARLCVDHGLVVPADADAFRAEKPW